MTRGSPPLRFLILVIGGWVCARGAFLGADWIGRERVIEPAVAANRSVDAVQAGRVVTVVASRGPSLLIQPSVHDDIVPLRPEYRAKPTGVEIQPAKQLWARTVPSAPRDDAATIASTIYADPSPLLSAVASTSANTDRWSGSAYAFVRRGQGSQLAAGGTLGGSQIGARISYRLNDDSSRPLSLSARAYLPTSDLDASEFAAGVEWQPLAGVPVRLLAERRQAIGARGRSAFSLLAHGGVSEVRVVGPVRLNAYGQAGVVGTRSRDLFADGAVRLAVPIDQADNVRVGAGLWAAAQPGVSRVDVGPSASVRITTGVRLSADWRHRIAGDARPRSGPSITLSTDF